MIWVSGCITVAGLVLGEMEGRNYDVLSGPVKKAFIFNPPTCVRIF